LAITIYENKKVEASFIFLAKCYNPIEKSEDLFFDCQNLATREPKKHIFLAILGRKKRKRKKPTG
jgi:hypothetical protein